MRTDSTGDLRQKLRNTSVGEFLESMGVRGYSPRTIENHFAALGYLAAWLQDRGVGRPSEVTKPMLDGYQRHLFHRRKADGTPLSFRAQHTRLVPIRALFKWLARSNRILYNPASELELPKLERRLPKAVLSASEAERVLAVPDLSEPVGLRDRTMLEILYATGVRRSELARLTVTDLDAERLTLTVRQGKNRKDRMIPTGQRAAAWAHRYLIDARPRLAVEPDDGTLFLTVDGTQFGVDRLTGLVAGYVKRSGVGKPGACHLFRHTMATLMLEGGADIRFIQQMLGHADISTTQIYTQVSLRQLSAIHQATHPAASNTSRRTRTANGPTEPASLPPQPAQNTPPDYTDKSPLQQRLHVYERGSAEPGPARDTPRPPLTESGSAEPLPVTPSTRLRCSEDGSPQPPTTPASHH